MRSLLVLFFSSGLMWAGSIGYTLTAGSDVITFTLPQQPSPIACNFASSCFGVSPAALVVNGTAVSNGQVNFYESVEGGGLTILEGATLLVNNNGPGNMPLFSGTLTSPTLDSFSNLQLEATSFGSPVYDEAFSVNVVGPASAPEAPTGLLFLAGVIASVPLFWKWRFAPAGILKR